MLNLPFTITLVSGLYNSSYYRAVVTIAPSCVISEIKRYICEDRAIFMLYLHSTLPWGSASEYCHNVLYRKIRTVVLAEGGQSSTFSRFDIIHERDRRRDRRTDTT